MGGGLRRGVAPLPDQPLRCRLGRALAAVLSVACLWGCGNIHPPEYLRPDTPEKSAWSRPANVSAAEAITPDWWKEFGDPYLDSLVNRAIAGNMDVRILAARIGVAKAQIGEARAGALPTATASAGASFQKTTGQPSSTQYNVNAQVLWEPDIWGKVEKGVQAQKAEYHASEADWRAGYLTLAAAVSTTYFQILQFDEQRDQQQRALGKNKDILAIFEAMHANGLIPNTQVLQQRAEVNKLTNDLLEFQRQRDLAVNALATLLGVPAGEFQVPAGHLQDRVRLPTVPAGLPAQLLARRPDVVAAEYRVLSAYDLVGQARLAQLPSLSLTSQGGNAALSILSLLKSFTFSFVPTLTLPAFDPNIKARVKTSEAQTKVAEAEYRKAVLGAFEEVENALVNLDAHKKQREELLQQTEHLQVVATQVQAQLREGIVSQLEVFESERSLLAAQLALLANHQQILADTVTLYKALGGGWPPIEVAKRAD